MKRRTLHLALGIPAGFILFLFLTVLFIPNDAIKGVLVRSAENAGYRLELTGFGKSFPLGLKAEAVELSSEKGALLTLRETRVHLKLVTLVTGNPALAYRGRIGTGEISGDLSLGKKQGWNIQCRGVRLEDIPYFATVAQARVAGELRLEGNASGVKGKEQGALELEVKGAELAGVKIGQMPLPDASYREVRGALSIAKGQGVLKSFTLNGDGVYLRLKGDTALAQPVGNSPLNLTLEMMPKPSFLERQKFIFLLLARYLVSPGVYNIPIRGTLAHPAL